MTHKSKIFSVKHYLGSIQNVQTKAKCLEWLKKRNAVHCHIGFIYQRGSFEQKFIY